MDPQMNLRLNLYICHQASDRDKEKKLCFQV